jgi:hypothetical protein
VHHFLLGCVFPESCPLPCTLISNFWLTITKKVTFRPFNNW